MKNIKVMLLTLTLIGSQAIMSGLGSGGRGIQRIFKAQIIDSSDVLSFYNRSSKTAFVIDESGAATFYKNVWENSKELKSPTPFAKIPTTDINVTLMPGQKQYTYLYSTSSPYVVNLVGKLNITDLVAAVEPTVQPTSRPRIGGAVRTIFTITGLENKSTGTYDRATATATIDGQTYTDVKEYSTTDVKEYSTAVTPPRTPWVAFAKLPYADVYGPQHDTHHRPGSHGKTITLFGILETSQEAQDLGEMYAPGAHHTGTAYSSTPVNPSVIQ